MDVCYIAAPLMPGRGRTTAENVERACALCRRAVEEGYAPIIVHPAIVAGAYGNDDNPEERDRGLRIDEALVTVVGEADGELWCLVDREADGTWAASTGVRRELVAFADTASPTLPQTVRVWELVGTEFRDSVLFVFGRADLTAVGLL